MKGALGLIVIALVVWAFWMTYEHLRYKRVHKLTKTPKK